MLLIFSSCDTPATQTFKVTETEEVQPTAIATEILPTPTETPDSNAPTGWTGKDSKGYYQEVLLNGELTKYYFETIKNNAGDVVFEDWLVEKTMDEGIPLLDWPSNVTVEGYEKDIAIMRLFCSVSMKFCNQIPQLNHIGVTDPNFNERFTSALRPILYERFYGYKPGDLWEFEKSLQKGAISYEFSLIEGDDVFSWNPSPTHGSIGIIENWEEMEGKKEFSLGDSAIRIEILGISDRGDLVYKVSVNTLPSDEQVVTMLFSGVGMILEKTNNLEDITKLNILDDMVYHASKLGSNDTQYVIIK